MDFCWLSWLFNFVEHASFEVAYARLEVGVDGSMVQSDGISCVFTDRSFDGFSFFIGRISASVLGSLSELSSHVNRSFHEGRDFFLNPVEPVAMGSSYVKVGKESVPIARKMLE